jgi:hypothetical protein
VLISDDMKLPDGWNWDKTIIRIPESDCANWPRIIKEIAPEAEQSLRRNCLKSYQQFSGDSLVSNIRLFFNTKNISAIL